MYVHSNSHDHLFMLVSILEIKMGLNWNGLYVWMWGFRKLSEGERERKFIELCGQMKGSIFKLEDANRNELCWRDQRRSWWRRATLDWMSWRGKKNYCTSILILLILVPFFKLFFSALLVCLLMRIISSFLSNRLFYSTLRNLFSQLFQFLF